MFSAPDGTIIEEPSPRPPDAGTANRRMCAGVYLDSDFRDLVLRKIYCDRNRWIAPSHGFSLTPLMVHAWRAWRLEVMQHVLIIAIFVTAGLWEWRAPAIAASLLAALHVGRRLFPLIGEIAAFYRGRGSYQEFERLRKRQEPLGYAMLLSLGVCAAVIISGLRTNLLWHGPPGPLLARSGLAGGAVVLALVGGVLAALGAVRQLRLNSLLRKDTDLPWPHGQRLSLIKAQEEHPFSVYSSFTPFVGSGERIVTWSFAQRLIRATTNADGKGAEYESPPFHAQSLVDHLKDKIKRLTYDTNPESRLPGLSVTDQVLIEGTHAYGYLPLLLNEPDSDDVREAIADTIERSNDAARHYLACQVESWGGEIVTTVFVHLSLQGRTLYLEFSTYALLPTREKYHVIDEIRGTGPTAVVRATWRSLAELPSAPLGLWRLPLAARDLVRAFLARTDGTVKARKGVNIGATISAREAATEESPESYFQYRDIIQHSKIIERRLIASVAEFLEGQQVDTSEFWQRANTVLNYGVIMTAGGTINVTDSAIGTQATASGGPAPATGASGPSGVSG